ncbi:hypothetical protein [Ferruginibacter sp.]|nr:hypothetical protein [Ferruginibacter sp.]
MKTIFRIIIICSWIFFAKKSFAQAESYFSGYKKRIKLLIENKDYDSIIAFSFHQSLDPPPPPVPVTLESLNNKSHYDDASLVCFKNDSCFVICMTYYDSGIAISNRILIKEKPVIDKLRQSWAKVQNEYFAPFVYEHAKDNKVRYDTLMLLHPAHANLTFISRGYYESKDFLPFATEETVLDYKNISYKHNSSLMLFTVYTVIKDLYNSLIKQLIYHK